MRRTRRRHRRRNAHHSKRVSSTRFSAHSKQKRRTTFRDTWKEVMKHPHGKKVATMVKSFWDINTVPEIRRGSMPGIGENTPLADLGKVPSVTVADGPKTKYKVIRKIRIRGRLLGDASQRRLMIYRGKPMSGKPRLKFLGWIAQTEYSAPKNIEKAGSDKANTTFYHQHNDENGSWPKGYIDQAGNIRYAKGTYRVKGKWLRR